MGAVNMAEIAAAGISVRRFDIGLMDQFIKWVDREPTTAKGYITNLRQFAAFLQYRGIKTPTREDIISYRQYLLEEHAAIQLAPDTAAGWEYRRDRHGNPIITSCKPGTAAQYMRTVKQFFKWAASAGYYPDICVNVHAPKTDRRQHKKDHLTPAQVIEVENGIRLTTSSRASAAEMAAKDTAGRIQRNDEQGKRLFAMFQLATVCGLRTIELHRANIKDLEIKGNEAWLYVWGKGHAEADCKKAVPAGVLEAVQDYLRCRSGKLNGTDPLFTSTGNRSGGKRIATTTISTMLKKALTAAGYDSERLTAHSLRHTAGQAAMEETGGNLYKTQKYMRHADPGTTEIYIRESESAAAEEMSIATRIYDRYHGTESGKADDLANLIKGMNPDQLEQLRKIASMMTGR